MPVCSLRDIARDVSSERFYKLQEGCYPHLLYATPLCAKGTWLCTASEALQPFRTTTHFLFNSHRYGSVAGVMQSCAMLVGPPGR